MTRLRAALLVVLVWGGVVAVGSTLVWVVISRAGEGVVPMSQPQADVTGSLPVPGGHGAPVRTSPGVTLAPRTSHPTSAPSTRTTSPATPPSSSSSSSAPTSPASSPSTRPPARPRAQRRSWSGAAGHVVVECRGSSARLVSAFPNADWRYTIGSRGPAQVQVRFSRTVGDDKAVPVDAHCVAGVPHFWLPGDDGGGDD